MEIRQIQPDDLSSLGGLYEAAFPAEELWPLVSELHAGAFDKASLVATEHGEIIAHVCFTLAHVPHDSRRVALLGPLAVAPGQQRQGVGSAIVRAGLEEMRAAGVARVLALGDPAYYGRFGFRPENAVETPCPIPTEWAEAWQSLALEETGTPPRGRLDVPAPWLDPALWAP